MNVGISIGFSPGYIPEEEAFPEKGEAKDLRILWADNEF